MVKIIERITYRDDDTLENTDRKIEIPGRVVGSQMVAGVLNIMGWHLVMIDREHLTSVQIDGENESDLLELKRLLVHSGQLESSGFLNCRKKIVFESNFTVPNNS